MEIETSDDNFEKDVIEASKQKPVLVDFWAEWCAPCKMLGPILERIAKELDDKMILVKLNLQTNQEKATEYGIMSIPAVKLFKDGKVVDEFVGLRGEEDIRGWLDSHLE
ncbi:MAG: thioredoxin [Candidatus Nanoarchaeia archaeon]